MSSKGFRVAKLASVPGATSSARLKLLTYNMALSQPGATVPLLENTSKGMGTSLVLADTLSSNFRTAAAPMTADGGTLPHDVAMSPEASRRWVRDADELCVASIRRSRSIDRINSYVASYKFEDPHWQPFLLPEVHVLPCQSGATASHAFASSSGDGNQSGGGDGGTEQEDAAPPLPYAVHVDYNKLTNIELLSRHANFALRHLVQKGHAMYFINYTQHSILEVRGLVEHTSIQCAYGIRGERLRTHMLHVGPLDVRDVIEIDPKTRRVSFNLMKKNVRRGVVAISLVEGYGTWFQRKPMLWQRARRIGALQSQLGAFEFSLCPCETVGRVRDYEVSLLEPHTRTLGAAGGMESVGIIASSQVAQNRKLYMGQFEAPVITAMDAVQQLAHRSALNQRLVRRPEETDGQARVAEDSAAAPVAGVPAASSRGSGGPHGDRIADIHRRLSMERLLPVAWVTRTPPPYVPLEGDLPFKLQLSKASVFHTEGPTPALFPSGGTVGTPFVKGVPLSLMEYVMHQGVDHYVFDDAPSARPMKWWNQKSNMPYNGHMYFVRSGLLDHVVPAEHYPNPMAPAAEAHRRSSTTTQRRKRQQRRALRKKTAVAAAATSSEQLQATSEILDDSAEELRPESTVETWSSEDHDLHGHNDADRQAEAALVAAEEHALHQLHTRPPIGDIITPNAVATQRAARYAARLQPPNLDASPSVAEGLTRGVVDAPTALLQRQLRLRKARRIVKKRSLKTTTEEEPE